MSEFEIFEAARKISDPTQRAAYLDGVCGGDAELRERIEALLDADARQDELVGASTLIPPPPKDPFEGRVIGGRFKLIQQIGEGGMGTVFMAQQIGDVRRKVALKLIRNSGLNAAASLGRFKAEEQALAMMDHPNIAKFFDAGQTEAGELFFVMELVMGVPIARYCDEHHLSVEKRIELFIQVCRAVQHAHQKGIIHRDLKPGNILVAEYDGKPEAKVIDFGLAKALGERLTDHSVHTLYGQILGTIQYMSPEQATLNQLDIDTRSDVYSLAVVLYELLTGTTPHSKQELSVAGFLEQLRMIREVDPPKASNRLSSSDGLPSLAAYRQTEPRRLPAMLRGELDLVLMKGLEKERNRRYGGADDFAADLERFLKREPVSAVPPSLRYQLSKSIRKHWKPLFVAAFLLLVSLTGVASFIWQEFQRREITAKAETNRLLAAEADAKRKLADARAESTRREAASSEYVGLLGQLAREETQRSPGWAGRSWEFLKKAAVIGTSVRNDADLRSIAVTTLLEDEFHRKPDWTFSEKVFSASYSDTAKTLAACVYGDNLHLAPRIFLFDANTGKVKHRLTGTDNWPSSGQLQDGAVSALRSRFEMSVFVTGDRALLAGTRWGRLYRWDLTKSPAEARFVTVGNQAVRLYVTPDERWCITFCYKSNQIRCWNAETLEPVSKSKEFDTILGNANIFPDSQSMLVHTVSGTRWLSLPGLEERQAFTTERGAGAFHPNGAFHTAFTGESVRAESWPEGVPLHTYFNPGTSARIHAEVASSAEQLAQWYFSKQGNAFAMSVATEWGDELRIWDALGGVPRWRFSVPAGSRLSGRTGYALSPNADRVTVIDERSLVQYSRLRSRLVSFHVTGHPNGPRYVRTAPDRSEVAVIGERLKTGQDTVLRCKTKTSSCDLLSPLVDPVGSIPAEAIDFLSYSPDGKWLATVGNNNPKQIDVIVLDRMNPNSVQSIALARESAAIIKSKLSAGAVAGFGWSASGKLLAAVDYELFSWNLQTTPATLVTRSKINSHLGAPHRYASLAMNGTDIGYALTIRSELRVFRLQGGSLSITKHLQVPGEGNSRICRIDPRNQRLAIGKADGSVILFDTAKEAFGTTLTTGHTDAVQSMVWLNESRLLTGGRDGTLAVWNVTSDGKTSLWYRLNLKGPVSDIAPTADGRGVYVAVTDETSLRVLDLTEIDAALAEMFSKSAPPSVPAESDAERPQPNLANQDQDIIGRVAFGANRNRSTEPVINYSAETAAAEWVVSIGGSVTIADRNGREIPLEAGQLPQHKYLVRDVRLDGVAGLTTEGLAKLRTCQALTTLELMNLPKLTDDGFAALEGSGIRSLSIRMCPALTNKVGRSLGKLNRMESLSLHAGSLTDDCLSQFAPLKKLSSLAIGEPGITNAGLAKLAAASPQLSFLDISSASNSGLTASVLASFDELTEVHLNGPQLTEEAIQSINSLPELKSLSLRHSVTDDTIRRLGQLQGVTRLSIQSNPVEDRTILSPSIYSEVTWPRSLAHLSFVGSKVTPSDDDLYYFSEQQQLRELGLDCRQAPPRYTLSGLARFRRHRPTVLLTDLGEQPAKLVPNFPAEREAAKWVLSVGGTLALKDSAGKVLPLADGKLPEVPFMVDACGFHGGHQNFNNADLSKLKACQNLTALHFGNHTQLTDEGLSNLKGIHFRDLIFSNCPLLTDKSLTHIGRFYDLQSLNAQGVAFTDAGVAGLKPLDTLREVSVATTQITDAGLLRLAEACPGIIRLSIDTCRDGKQTVRGIVKFPNLTRLHINGQQLTDDAVSAINSVPTLTHLDLIPPLSDASFMRFSGLKSIHTIYVSSDDSAASGLSATILGGVKWPEGLQTLILYGNEVSPRDQDLLSLAKLPNLKLLAVDCLQTSRHLQHYTHAGFVNLRKLRPDMNLGVEHNYYASGKPLPETAPPDNAPKPQ